LRLTYFGEPNGFLIVSPQRINKVGHGSFGSPTEAKIITFCLDICHRESIMDLVIIIKGEI
jgi:hypothetical protein